MAKCHSKVVEDTVNGHSKGRGNGCKVGREEIRNESQGQVAFNSTLKHPIRASILACRRFILCHYFPIAISYITRLHGSCVVHIGHLMQNIKTSAYCDLQLASEIKILGIY